MGVALEKAKKDKNKKQTNKKPHTITLEVPDMVNWISGILGVPGRRFDPQHCRFVKYSAFLQLQLMLRSDPWSVNSKKRKHTHTHTHTNTHKTPLALHLAALLPILLSGF